MLKDQLRRFREHDTSFNVPIESQMSLHLPPPSMHGYAITPFSSPDRGSQSKDVYERREIGRERTETGHV